MYCGAKVVRKMEMGKNYWGKADLLISEKSIY
jgi:hypothetical protein